MTSWPVPLLATISLAVASIVLVVVVVGLKVLSMLMLLLRLVAASGVARVEAPLGPSGVLPVFWCRRFDRELLQLTAHLANDFLSKKILLIFAAVRIYLVLLNCGHRGEVLT